MISGVFFQPREHHLMSCCLSTEKGVGLPFLHMGHGNPWFQQGRSFEDRHRYDSFSDAAICTLGLSIRKKHPADLWTFG
jgi:hypothetical protein